MSNLLFDHRSTIHSESITAKTAHIQVVFGGQNVIVNGKRFQFARNYTDVQEFNELLKELGFIVSITHNY
jgi:hypothetical protein